MHSHRDPRLRWRPKCREDQVTPRHPRCAAGGLTDVVLASVSAYTLKQDSSGSVDRAPGPRSRLFRPRVCIQAQLPILRTPAPFDVRGFPRRHERPQPGMTFSNPPGLARLIDHNANRDSSGIDTPQSTRDQGHPEHPIPAWNGTPSRSNQIRLTKTLRGWRSDQSGKWSRPLSLR